MNRKETAWKKSRKFGDIKGGRRRNKWLNTFFNRLHNLEVPNADMETPIFITDNPSRDFFFPIDVADIEAFLQKLPEQQVRGISYIWLKKQSHEEYQDKDSLQGCYVWGAQVQLIVLYSFPTSLKMDFGKKKPGKKTLTWYKGYCDDLREEKNNWYLQWTEEGIKRYYLERLLLHEIGHHVDNIHKYNKASQTKAENWADGYAYFWSNKLRLQEKI